MRAQQAALAATENVVAHTVELVYGDAPFELTSPTDPRHLQLRWPAGEPPVWSKENLLNLGVQRLLPRDWTIAASVDAELSFDDPHWARAAARALSRGALDLLQPFTHVLRDGRRRASILAMASGAAPYNFSSRQPAMAFAWSRRWFDAAGGFFENLHGGSAAALTVVDDAAVACGVCAHATPALCAALLAYGARGRAARPPLRFGALPGTITHAPHGSYCRRGHFDAALARIEPEHFAHTRDGLFAPSPAMPPEVRARLFSFFADRREDEPEGSVQNCSNTVKKLAANDACAQLHPPAAARRS